MNNTTPQDKRVVRPLTQNETEYLAKILEETPYLSDADIAEKFFVIGLATDMSPKDLRNKIRYARRKIVSEEDGTRARVVKNSDDSLLVYTSTPCGGDGSGNENLDLEIIRKAGFNPDEYVVSSYASSEWECGGETLTSTRFKLRRRRPDEMDPDLASSRYTTQKVEEIFGTKEVAETEENNEIDEEEALARIRGLAYNGITVKNDDGQFSLIIPLTDLHIGEGNAEKMAKSYRATFVNYILPDIKAKYFTVPGKVRTIDVACLGDLIHCDNGSGTTTAGTPLQPNSSAYKSFDVCVDFITWLVDTLISEFKTPVRVIYTYGNHDNNLGFGLMRTVAASYRKISDVEFIINENLVDDEDEWFTHAELNPEYMQVGYGKVGITYCHGKFMKKNTKEIPEVANKNARRDYDYNVVMYGHLHHLSASSTGANQHNYGLTTPNFVRDKFGKSLGCVTDPEFYLFEVNHNTNRVNFTQYPSLPYNKQPEV